MAKVWGLEQHLGEAGGWNVAEGPRLSPIGGEKAQAGAQGHSGRNQVEGRWGLELRVRSKIIQEGVRKVGLELG